MARVVPSASMPEYGGWKAVTGGLQAGLRMGRRCFARLRYASWLFGCVGCLLSAPNALAESAPEYALKAAFIYNFALFTEWPAQVGPNVTLCVLGSDPFGAELDSLVGEPVGKRRIAVRRIGSGDRLDQCNLLFIARSHIHAIPNVIAAIGEGAVLTVADSPEATQRGVGINMEMERSKITFDINRKVIKRAGLTLSSKMLNLARNVVE